MKKIKENKVTANFNLQIASTAKNIPSANEIQSWLNIISKEFNICFEVNIKIVDLKEITQLNNDYRGKNNPTNVLAFPCFLPKELKGNKIGDIAICAPIVEREAITQNKTLDAHWAHMVIHSLLHLLGYDHNDKNKALEMENKEINLLSTLGFTNPYGDIETL